MFLFQLIVVFAIVAAALAGVPGDRQERAAVYSTYSNLVASPYSYGVSPYAYSGVYSGVPAISTYSSYPAYTGYPAVRYY